MVISRVSTHKITVEPQTKRVRIVGAHVRPISLAYLTKLPIHTMLWLIIPVDLFQQTAMDFKKQIDRCANPEQMFSVVAKTFLVRDLSLISNAIELIDQIAGTIQITELAKHTGVSDRTIRNHFDNHIGCPPKEYISLIRFK